MTTPEQRPSRSPVPRIATLLEPSRLAPVELDLRRVFWAGIALWAVGLVIAGGLAVAGQAEPRLVWICATGALLGFAALGWEHRRQQRVRTTSPTD